MDGTTQTTSGPTTPGNAAASGATPAAAAVPQPAAVASPTSAVTIFNIPLLLMGLWVAIGITSEIVTRKEDFSRVEGYHKWLVTCSAGSTDKDCKKFDGNAASSLTAEIEVTATQVRRYHSFNAFGAPDRCHVPAVFASQIGHFWEDCERILNLKAQAAGKMDAATEAAMREQLHKPQNKTLIEAILRPSWPHYSWVGFDEQAKEPLYFALVLVSALIGSLIAGLRTASFSTHRDVALGLGAGFAVYILLRGGNFVFFTGGTSIDILNPFTAAAVGLLVGLFNEKAFGLLGNAMPATLPTNAQQGAGNQGTQPDTAPSLQATAATKNAGLAQANALAAATKTHETILEVLKKAAPDSDAQKALQAMATTALEAKTKAEEAAKAQGEATKPM